MNRSWAIRAAKRMAAASPLPAIILMTDDERLADPLAAASALPKGSAVILRSRDAKTRAELGKELRTIARKRGLFLLVAGDDALAARLGADGVHLAETKAGHAAALRARRRGFVTLSAHSFSGLGKKCDALILSAVFLTQSHPGRAALGPVRANLMARQSPRPVYALGGIDGQNARRLSGFCGIAGIGTFSSLQ